MECQLCPISRLSRAASTTSDEISWRLFTLRTHTECGTNFVHWTTRRRRTLLPCCSVCFPHLGDMLPDNDDGAAHGSRRFPGSLGERRFAYRGWSLYLLLWLNMSLSFHTHLPSTQFLQCPAQSCHVEDQHWTVRQLQKVCGIIES